MATKTSANVSKVDGTDLSGRIGPWSDGPGPLYRRLADAIGSMVADGGLRDGDQLPPERQLAEVLNVSRGTVVSAYERLRDLDLVTRVQGSGTVIRSESPSKHERRELAGAPLFSATANTVDFLLATPTVLPEVLDIIGSVDFLAHPKALDNTDPSGLIELRQAVADHITRSGLSTRPEEVMIVNGAQQAVSLAAPLFVGSGDVVLTESTSWPGLADSIRGAGGRVHGVSMDEHGLKTDELRTVVDRLRPVMIGLNPHHHNPTATRLSDHRRREVADIAADFGAVLLEDRVSADLGFDGYSPPPFAVHRPDGAHVIADSINKVAWPGLRVGWIRADASVINELRPAKAQVDLYTPIPSQLMALAVLENFDVIRQLRMAQLEVNHRVLRDALGELLPDWEIGLVRGGLVLWVKLPHGSAARFAQFARRFGVAIATGREFGGPATEDQHLRVPATADPTVLRAGVQRLAAAWAAIPDELGELAPTPATLI